MIKVGLIGCGGMGSTHANCYAALENVKLVALADLDAEKAKKLCPDAEIYSTGMELIEKADVDVIDICLPTYLHTEHAVKAMEKGRHVFLEKPVCLNMEQAKLLLETAEKTGVKIQIGQVIRFWDEYVWLKNAYDEGKYGKIISGVFSRLSPNPKWSWNNWYNKPELSGTMATDLHIHDVDFVRWLMGTEPEEVYSRGTRDTEGVLEQIFTTYKFGETVISSEGCWDYPDKFPFSMKFRVKFEKATAEYDSETLTVYPVDGEPFVPQLEKAFAVTKNVGINLSNMGAYFNELKYFTDNLAAGETPDRAPLQEAVKSLELDLKEIDLAGGVVNVGK